MAGSRYSYDVDLNNLNTSHSLAVLSVRPGSRVLDIGAADGSVARLLVDRGCRTSGVEVDEQAAAALAAYCERVVTADVEHVDLADVFGDTRFDVVLLLDVLEHLRDPLEVLRRVVRLLGPGGRVIASIPNVTHGAVRLNLLRGNFTYTSTGLLDRTHLRFFDRAAVDALFNTAGLDILDRLRVTRGLTETEIPIDLATFSRDVIEDVERDPESRTFQFVIVATVNDGARRTDGSSSLAERLQQQIRDWERRFAEVEAYARSLEVDRAARAEQADHVAELTRHAEELRATLTARMEDIHVRDRELRQVQADLAVKEAFASDLRQSRANLETVVEDLQEAIVQSRANFEKVVEALQEAIVRNQQRADERDAAHDAEHRDASMHYQAVVAQLSQARAALAGPSVQTALRVSAGLRKYPRVHRLLKWLISPTS